PLRAFGITLALAQFASSVERLPTLQTKVKGAIRDAHNRHRVGGRALRTLRVYECVCRFIRHVAGRQCAAAGTLDAPGLRVGRQIRLLNYGKYSSSTAVSTAAVVTALLTFLPET